MVCCGELDPAEHEPGGDQELGEPPPQSPQHGPGDDERGGDQPGSCADDRAQEQGDDGVPLAGRDGGGEQSHGDPDHVEDDLRGAGRVAADRFLDHRDGARPSAEGRAAIRIRHDATSSYPGGSLG